MKTRHEPTPHSPTPLQAKPAAESSRSDVTVRVSIVNERAPQRVGRVGDPERHDEEEVEAGYGHGV